MTFQGNINTIHVPTIFQLFFFSTKTGILEVGIDEFKFNIYILNGNICNVETNFLKTSLLELYFIKSGLSLEKIKELLSKSKKQAEVLNLLIQEKTVSKAKLDEMKAEHIKELLLDIIGIEFGKFTFNAMTNQEMEKFKRSGIKIDIQKLIMDSLMRAEAIANYFSDLNLRSGVKIVKAPIPKGYLDYCLANGIKKTPTLIGALNSGKYSLFETFKAIEKLIKDGNIVLTETETATDELRKEFPEEVESLLSESEYFNEGYNYFKEGLYSQALNEFQKVLASFADNPIIYLYIAVCDIYLSKLKAAGEVLTKVLKISPEHPFVYLLLAKIFFRLKNDAKAVGYLKQGLKHNSGNVPLLWEMAGYFYKVRDLTNATGRYKEILKIQPDNVLTYLKLGAIYLKEGNTAQAVEAWKHALKHDPENKIAKTNLESIGEK